MRSPTTMSPVSLRQHAAASDVESQRSLFPWITFDARSLLPRDWDRSILTAAADHSRARILTPTSTTSRERDRDAQLKTLAVNGRELRQHLPWLAELYEHEFRDLAQRCVSELVTVASDPRYGVVINIKQGNDMHYECHIDSNPLEGLLYVTSHPRGKGGELVVSNRGDVPTIEAVDDDCTVIYPMTGHLIFFNGSNHSHYVRPLVDPSGLRVVVAMNYYTPSLPESERPPDLNQHLFGEP
jgi:hypothetical protein